MKWWNSLLSIDIVLFRDKINVAVLQLLEQEKLQKLQKKWWYDKGECVIETDTKVGYTNITLWWNLGFLAQHAGLDVQLSG